MAVAMINDTSYETLAKAITAANSMSGDILIKLTSDTEFNSALTIKKNFILRHSMISLRPSRASKT